jgi:hypothetical protein
VQNEFDEVSHENGQSSAGRRRGRARVVQNDERLAGTDESQIAAGGFFERRGVAVEPFRFVLKPLILEPYLEQ